MSKSVCFSCLLLYSFVSPKYSARIRIFDHPHDPVLEDYDFFLLPHAFSGNAISELSHTTGDPPLSLHLALDLFLSLDQLQKVMQNRQRSMRGNERLLSSSCLFDFNVIVGNREPGIIGLFSLVETPKITTGSLSQLRRIIKLAKRPLSIIFIIKPDNIFITFTLGYRTSKSAGTTFK